MTIFLIVIHVIVCIALIGLVLIQRGRGAGLVESFAGVESMFGTKTNAFLTRATTVLSVAFFITCLLLAVVSVRQSKSLMGKTKTQAPAATSAAAPQIPATTSSIPVTSPVTQPTQDAPKAQ
ncbi:MAG: preprotein translocase subunit SecG [Candidatus Omnitrophica bacterium]|nr:preprotein translocase subunit SecG [Candidatus Omnitrophota bacterium]